MLNRDQKYLLRYRDLDLKSGLQANDNHVLRSQISQDGYLSNCSAGATARPETDFLVNAVPILQF